jgi:hypothetical protein
MPSRPLTVFRVDAVLMALALVPSLAGAVVPALLKPLL